MLIVNNYQTIGMTAIEKNKCLDTLKQTIEELKENQKLIMGILTSDLDNGIKNKDLNVVRWGYNQRFKMLQREVQRITKKYN